MRKPLILVLLLAAGALSLAVQSPRAQSYPARSTAPSPVVSQALQDVRDGIVWIDYLLARAEAGDFIISLESGVDEVDDNLNRFLPINRDEVMDAIRQAVRTGKLTPETGAAMIVMWSRETGDRVRVLRLVREDMVKEEKALVARSAARPPLQPWELGRPPASRVPETVAECVAEGVWSNVAADRGSSTWTIDADGVAVESGMGGARGTASLNGGTLTIDWRTGAVAGTYSIVLADDCSGGEGTLSFSDGPPGFDRRSGKAVFTRVSGPA